MSSIDATAIHDSLDPGVAARMEQLEVFAEIGSTNTYLLEQPAPATGKHRVAIADHQTAGRGRQDREWISAPGSSLCLSLAYTFATRPDNLPGLTLAIGVAALDALRHSGVNNVNLKWPNDLVAMDGKLGGMLAESQFRGEASAIVVAGIGINFDLPVQLIQDNASRWAQRAVDLNALVNRPPSREAVSGALIDNLVESLTVFEVEGFSAFASTWREHDWLRGRHITVEQSDGRISGTAAGIDDDGALLLLDGGDVSRVISGSIVLNGATGTAA
jgi:BirA family biotin operon repressor/biotin-[acetyl-CoA-carboxylase] ligase